jgi:hypothetical protein
MPNEEMLSSILLSETTTFFMSSASPSNFACLKLKQRAAVRIVLGANSNDHTEPIFKHLNILPLDALCKLFDIQLMQLLIQDFLPDSFNNV